MLVVVAGIAMGLTAATTGAIPFLIQMAADDVFIGKNAAAVYTITAMVLGVTVCRAIASYMSMVTIGYLGHRFIATGNGNRCPVDQ